MTIVQRYNIFFHDVLHRHNIFLFVVNTEITNIFTVDAGVVVAVVNGIYDIALFSYLAFIVVNYDAIEMPNTKMISIILVLLSIRLLLP